ncbi:MAG: hypothetical protein EON92_00655 [Burkholderiales bacterium]|nr:MAG: hypothetical protein EON92_00655 [Burkholderiales bacterium]
MIVFMANRTTPMPRVRVDLQGLRECRTRIHSPVPLFNSHQGFTMNSIIYLVGLVVVVLFILSFFGLR